MENISQLLSSPNTPAWGQAIGAILAIVASFLVASRQHKNELKRDNEKRKQERLDQIYSLIVIFDNASSACQNIARKVKEQEAIWELEMNFLFSQRERLNSIPIFDIPSPRLVASISNLISRLQVAEISLRQLNIESQKGSQLTQKFFEAMELPLHLASDFAVRGIKEAQKIATEENIGDVNSFILKEGIEISQRNETYVMSFMNRITKKES
jgi:hypothetical protein